MFFVSIPFLLFIAAFLLVYYAIPRNYRYLVILAGSYIFYGWNNIKMLPVLCLSTAITYIGGQVLARKKNKGWFALFFSLNIAVLLVFKYTNFVLSGINQLLSIAALPWGPAPLQNIILPVGLSFYVFQSTTYLNDVYRRGCEPERNPFRYAAFVSFFPALLSGPIQKSRDLLPQLRNPAAFDTNRAIGGFVLIVWGLFQKICVANTLAQIISTVYSTYDKTAYYVVAVIGFSLYIYADFSSYSDMARGISKLLGIEIHKNFNNPYLSTSLSEFWKRWHVSLNEWFVENVYIPLGGNRKGTLRKYCNILAVFFLSGLWHGASWNFVLWGVINGMLVVAGQLLRPWKRRLYTALSVDESLSSIVFLKRAVVFWIVSMTWVFFRNDIHTALHVVSKLLLFSPVRLFDSAVLTIGGTAAKTLLAAAMTAVFCMVQYARKDEAKCYCAFRKQPVVIQCCLLALVLCVCLFVGTASTATLNTEFLYFQF